MRTKRNERLVSELEKENAKLTADAALLRKEGARLRRLTQRLHDALEGEHLRLAREIHDLLGQSLMILKIDVSELVSKLASSDQVLHAQARKLPGDIDAVVRSARQIAAHLRTPVLEDLGLCSALEWTGQRFTERTGIPCIMELDAPDVPIDAGRALCAIAEEALTNVMRHADAGSVRLRLAATATEVALELSDDGKGFHAPTVEEPHTLGLLAMEHRAEAIGAKFCVRSELGRGTTVSVRLALSNKVIAA